MPFVNLGPKFRNTTKDSVWSGTKSNQWRYMGEVEERAQREGGGVTP